MKRPHVTIRFEMGDGLRLGPGKIRLLELIAETGSISAAARAMNMSYRRAWVLIDEMKAILGAPAVTTNAGGAGGGGASLTEQGHAIVQKFRTVETSVKQHTDGLLHELAK